MKKEKMIKKTKSQEDGFVDNVNEFIRLAKVQSKALGIEYQELANVEAELKKIKKIKKANQKKKNK
jgi:hypothetical protein